MKNPIPTSRDQIERWLKDVVIGLGLCPFAAQPWQDGRVRIVIDQSTTHETVLEHLQQELIFIQNNKHRIETTLFIVEQHLQDFLEFNQFLDWVDRLLEQEGWLGKYQIATFHPDYQFAGTRPDDAENLTNRAPLPILHILSEQSLTQQLADTPHPEAIPQKNISKMNSLTREEKQRLFPYLSIKD